MKKIPKGKKVYVGGKKYVGEVPDELAHVLPPEIKTVKTENDVKSSSASRK